MRDVSPDVFIVGGGPAGLAAAIAARQAGFSVTVADSRQPPVDKTCGEGIMPEGVAALLALGVDLRSVPSAPVRGIRLLSDGSHVEAEFAAGPGYGVRRTELHLALIERAEQMGVRLCWGRSIADFGSIQARWIIGADGTASRVRTWAGLDAFSKNTQRFGFTRHYRIKPWTDHIEGYYGDGVQVFITPLVTDEIGVATLPRDPKLRVESALDRFPVLREKLAFAPVISAEAGGMTASRVLKRVVSGKVALVGDASGSVDAITAEGLSLSFRQGLALAEAMKAGDLSLYATAHRRLARRPRFMAALMLAMDRSPWIRRQAFRTMAADPAIFRHLLALHAGGLRAMIGQSRCPGRIELETPPASPEAG